SSSRAPAEQLPAEIACAAACDKPWIRLKQYYNYNVPFPEAMDKTYAQRTVRLSRKAGSRRVPKRNELHGLSALENPAPSQLLQLQRILGNSDVGRLVQRKAGTSSAQHRAEPPAGDGRPIGNLPMAGTSAPGAEQSRASSGTAGGARTTPLPSAAADSGQASA